MVDLAMEAHADKKKTGAKIGSMGQTRKQKGGRRMYADVNEIDETEIEEIFCSGRGLGDFSRAEKPLFIMKWGPPGSGKSSETVRSTIASLGVAEDNYLDFTPDKIIEALLPFRFDTAAAKLTSERILANIKLGNAAHAKQLMQKYALNRKQGFTRKLQTNVADYISDGTFDRSVSEDVQKLLADVVYDKVTKSYRYWRGEAKNTSGVTIRDKMERFLIRAMEAGVHIQYETMGSGYGESGVLQQMSDEFTGRVMTRGATKRGMIEIFKNTWEELLGRIVYSADGIPERIEAVNPSHIPEKYQIIIVYPILPRAVIIKRAMKRAISQMTQKEETTTEYREVLKGYTRELQKLMFGETRKKAEVADLIDAAMEAESLDFVGKGLDIPYSEYIAGLSKSEETFYFPYYRAIAPQRIMDVAEQAFQYAVDYFLKQYILLGRIKSVIYISNLSGEGPKS